MLERLLQADHSDSETDLPGLPLIALRILRLLPLEHLLTLSATCRAARALCFDHTLWRGYHLSLVYNKPLESKRQTKPEVPEKVKFISEVFPLRIPGCITSIYWQAPGNSGDFAKKLYEIIKINPEIKDLHLIDEEIVDVQAKFIFPLLKNVHTLGLTACKSLTGSSFSAMGELANLKNIDLSFSENITNASFETLMRCLVNLRSVNVNYVSNLVDSGVGSILTNHSESLEYLEIDGEHNSDEVFAGLGKCIQLKTLIVNFCMNLSDEALSGILEIPNLEVLHLKKSEKGFTEAGLKDFFAKKPVSNIREVFFTECLNFSDEVAETLAENVPGVKSISLFGNWNVSERGMRAIAAGCPGLEYLDISCLNKVTGECFAIQGALLNLKTLKMDACEISPEMVQILQEKTGGKLEIPVAPFSAFL